MTMLFRSKQLLLDNHGDENISKMIWVAIVFIAGAILLGLIAYAFRAPISQWYAKTIGSWFDNSKSRQMTDEEINARYSALFDGNGSGGYNGGDGATSVPTPVETITDGGYEMGGGLLG